MKDLIRLIRVEQWVKNVFLFVPVFFSGVIPGQATFLHLVLGVLSFSLVASAVYVLNDLVDVESDRKHPVKCARPLASGAVPKRLAIPISLGCCAAGLIPAWSLSPLFLTMLVAYLLINLAYSFRLKHIAIIDINCIAGGFLLRVFGGGAIAGIVVSHWLGVMTYLLAMFLALAKRRDDLLIKERSGVVARRAIDGYGLEFVNAAMVIFAAVLLVGYTTYTAAPEVVARYGTPFLFLSVIPVATGLLRYLQLALVMERTGSPTRLVLHDRFLQAVILAWVSFFAVIMYLR